MSTHTCLLGIGKSTALRYAEEGCTKIAIVDVNTATLASAEKEILGKHPGVSVLPIAVDVRSKVSVQAMVDKTVETFGRVDYCCNSAGIWRFGDTSILSEQDYEETFRVNVLGVFSCAQAEINAMLKQEPILSKSVNQPKTHSDGSNCYHRGSPFPSRGSIVNIASEAAYIGIPDLPSYVATKAGVVGQTKAVGFRTLRKEMD
jgi:NAD(P)-dependent dehydrogenase (short-subunit alcohol dehydrogenase family)